MFCLLQYSTSYAVSPGTWMESTEEDFKKGKIEDVSFTSEGVILLAPQYKMLFSSSEPYIWSLVNDREGNIYAGSGINGIIYKIGHKETEAKTFFDSHQMGVHALAIDSIGNIYAGTSKEGIIYKVTPDGAASVFYDSKESYIWALAIDKEDNLYAGTGDGGMLLKITPDGTAKVLADLSESHILSLILDREGNILAGSGNEGRVYKVTQNGKIFCIYDTSEPEVRSLVMDSKNNIYAATSPAGSGASGFTNAGPSSAKIYKITKEGDVKVIFGLPPQGGPAQPEVPGPKDIHPPAIDEDMLADIMASAISQDIPGQVFLPPAPISAPTPVPETEVPVRFLALAIDGEDNVYAGSGDKGLLYKITPEEEIITLYDSESHEVLSLLFFNRELYFGTGNPGGIHNLSSGYALKGKYISSVHDGQFLSNWGRIEWKADGPDKTSVTIQTRSGNTDEPDTLWSDWSEEYKDPKGSKITSPAARFIQFRANLWTEDRNWTPLLREVSLIYITKNQPPSLSRPVPGEQKVQEFSLEGKISQAGSNTNGLKKMKRGILSGEGEITWSATDPNGDALIHDLYYKNAMDEKWKRLEEDVEVASYSIDTVKFPDGDYLIKVVASDRTANTPDSALQVEKISEEFIIDNTPPQVLLNPVQHSKDGMRLNGEARDNMTIIVNGEYCLNNGKWIVFLPEDGLFDSKSERFFVILEKLEEGENTVSVKVMDEAGNTGVSSVTFKEEK